MRRFGRALVRVLRHEQVIFIIMWEDNLNICAVELLRTGVCSQLDSTLLRCVLEVFESTIHEELEASLLLHEKAVFL